MPSPWTFKKHGQCGMEVSELFPHVAEHVDDLALIRSMHSLSPAHGPALFQMNTGSILAGHPERRQLGDLRARAARTRTCPGFIVFTDYRGGPINGAAELGQRLHAGGLSRARSSATPAPHRRSEAAGRAHARSEQREWLRLLHELNEKHADAESGGHELSARIHSYELAFRMQTHAPDAIDIGKESAATRKLYGVGEEPTDYFGRQALMARRLVERGVRFVQIFSGGGNFEPSWDAHWDLKATTAALRRDRQADRRPDQGPQEPRPVRLDADRLARRVRPPPADLGAHGRPRPQPQRLQRLAGRRRRQGRHRRRRDRRVRLPRGREQEVGSTSCTRPSCACWGSITRS